MSDLIDNSVNKQSRERSRSFLEPVKFLSSGAEYGAARHKESVKGSAWCLSSAQISVAIKPAVISRLITALQHCKTTIGRRLGSTTRISDPRGSDLHGPAKTAGPAPRGRRRPQQTGGATRPRATRPAPRRCRRIRPRDEGRRLPSCAQARRTSGLLESCTRMLDTQRLRYRGAVTPRLIVVLWRCYTAMDCGIAALLHRDGFWYCSALTPRWIAVLHRCHTAMDRVVSAKRLAAIPRLRYCSVCIARHRVGPSCKSRSKASD